MKMNHMKLMVSSKTHLTKHKLYVNSHINTKEEILLRMKLPV